MQFTETTKGFFEDKSCIYAVSYWTMNPNAPKPEALKNFNCPNIKVQKEGAEALLGFSIWVFDNYIRKNPVFAMRAARVKHAIDSWIKAELCAVTSINTRDFLWFLANSIETLGKVLGNGGDLFSDSTMRAIFVSGWKPCFDKMHTKSQKG